MEEWGAVGAPVSTSTSSLGYASAAYHTHTNKHAQTDAESGRFVPDAMLLMMYCAPAAQFRSCVSVTAQRFRDAPQPPAYTHKQTHIHTGLGKSLTTQCY